MGFVVRVRPNALCAAPACQLRARHSRAALGPVPGCLSAEKIKIKVRAIATPLATMLPTRTLPRSRTAGRYYDALYLNQLRSHQLHFTMKG